MSDSPQLHVLVSAEQAAIMAKIPELASIANRYDESLRELSTYADEIEAARAECNDDLEIDDNPICSANDEGVWISAWIWVPFPEPEDDEEEESTDATL